MRAHDDDDVLGTETRVYSGPVENATLTLDQVPLTLRETFPDGVAIVVDEHGTEYEVELEAFRAAPETAAA